MSEAPMRNNSQKTLPELYPLNLAKWESATEISPYDAVLASMGIDPFLIKELRELEQGSSGDAQYDEASPSIHFHEHQAEFDQRFRAIQDAISSLELPCVEKANKTKTVLKDDFIQWLQKARWQIPERVARAMGIKKKRGRKPEISMSESMALLAKLAQEALIEKRFRNKAELGTQVGKKLNALESEWKPKIKGRTVSNYLFTLEGSPFKDPEVFKIARQRAAMARSKLAKK